METRQLKKLENVSINISEAEIISRLIINLQNIREKELNGKEISNFSGWKDKNIKVLTQQINRLIEIVGFEEQKDNE